MRCVGVIGEPPRRRRSLDPLRRSVGVRVLHLLMAAYLLACGIELVDRAGWAGDDSALASTAATLRDTWEGDDPFGIGAEVRDMVDALSTLFGSFREAGDAL